MTNVSNVAARTLVLAATLLTATPALAQDAQSTPPGAAYTGVSAPVVQPARFLRFLGNDVDQTVLRDVTPTADGGYVAVGFTKIVDLERWDAWVVRLDRDGDTVWQRLYQSLQGLTTYWDRFHQVVEMDSGDLLVLGEHGFTGLPWLLRLDADGNLLEQRNIDEGSIFLTSFSLDQLVAAPDGQYALGGSVDSLSKNHAIVELDEDLNVVSDLHYNEPGSGEFDRERALIATSDGGYLVAGFRDPGINEGLISKIKHYGPPDWQLSLDSPDPSQQVEFLAAAEASNGDFIVAGLIWWPVPPFTADNVGVVARVSAGSKVVWARTYDDGELATTLRSVQTYGRDHLVSGTVSGGTLVMKIDGAGNVLWNKRYPGVVATVMRRTPDRGAILAGTQSGTQNAAVLKIDAAGNTGAACAGVGPVPLAASEFFPIRHDLVFSAAFLSAVESIPSINEPAVQVPGRFACGPGDWHLRYTPAPGAR